MTVEERTFKKKVYPYLNGYLQSTIRRKWNNYSKNSTLLYGFNRELRQYITPYEILCICARLKIVGKCNDRTYLVLSTKAKIKECHIKKKGIRRLYRFIPNIFLCWM